MSVVCRKQQQQQQQAQTTQPQQRMLQSLLTGGTQGASSSRPISQATSFVKKWPHMSATDIEAATVSIAMFFYAANLPHALIEHPDFRAMILSLAPWMEGHIPTRKVLSTTLLDKVYGAEKARVETWLAEQVCRLQLRSACSRVCRYSHANRH
jgi:hypothetical protein